MLDEAKRCYQEALRLAPDNEDAQENLAFLLSAENEPACCVDEKGARL